MHRKRLVFAPAAAVALVLSMIYWTSAALVTPPIHAAFFYPWFPESWTQGGVYPYTQYHPSLGYYSSSDDANIDKQVQLATQAHLSAMIGSWWGQGHHTDTAFAHILSHTAGGPLQWSLYYEA